MNNPLENARKQLGQVAEILGFDALTIKKLSRIDRFIEGNIEIKLDNGKTKKFKAFRSEHNNALGPYKGGIRFHPGVSVDEVKALSMWMTWKTAMVGIPYGGGKGGVIVEPSSLSKRELERLSRVYIRLIAKYIGSDKDIPAPDVNTNGRIMAWMLDEYEKIIGRKDPGALTGKPLELGGSKGRTEATGLGGFYILEAFAKKFKKPKKNITLAIQGCGNVGSYFARFAYKAGYKIVAISDSRNTIYDSKGMDAEKALAYKEKNKTLVGFPAKVMASEEIVGVVTDIFVPAALENAIHENNVAKLKCRYVLELANGPTTPEAEEILTKKGILIIPDVLANAGGVAVSYFEWVQNLQNYYWEEKEVYAKLKKLMLDAYFSVEKKYAELKSVHKGINMRMAAYAIAVERVRKAMELRGEL
jgi:glutamate dehydrogenase/leucine dehydrogenase